MSVGSNRNSGSGDTLVNMNAAQLAAQIANLAAQLEFQKERFRLLELPQFKQASQMQIDELAFRKSQSSWENAFKEATMTGTYQGKPTTQWLTEVAQLTGVFNGQQTLQGKLTDAQIAQMTQSLLNTQRLTDLEYLRRGDQREQWGAEHRMALENQQASLTGYLNGLPTFERQQWEANQATGYLNLMASLRGPENAFKQLEVLQNTPQGLLQMARNWAGMGSAQGFAATAAPQRATVQGLLSDPTGTTGPNAPWSAPPQALPEGQAGPGQQTWGMPTTIAGTQFAPVAQTGGGNSGGGVQGYTPGMGMPAPPAPGDVAEPNPYLPRPLVTGPTGPFVPAPVPPQDPGTPGELGLPYQPSPTYGGNGTGGGDLGAMAMPGFEVDPPGVQAPIQAYNYEPRAGGGTGVYPPGNPAPFSQFQYSTSTPVSPATSAAMAQGAQGYTPGVPGSAPPVPRYQPSAMPAPSQINAREYNRSTGYEKKLGWARYEAEGWDKEAAQQVYAKSLPQYGVRRGTTGTVRI